MTGSSPSTSSKPETPTARHPGRGRFKARTSAKGRGVEPAALAQVRKILGKRRRKPDLLVEHLHLIQDQRGYLPASLLAALAQEMKMPLVQVWEVASFYHNFEIVKDESAPEPLPTIRVCDSLPCALAGAEELIKELSENPGGAGFRVERGACMGRCQRAPVVRLGRNYLEGATWGAVDGAVKAGKRSAARCTAPRLPDYEANGGYELLRACRDGKIEREAVLEALDASGLRGLGGAGFPTGRKWRLVAEQPAPRLMAVNADESEPGTFKDRHYLLEDPHRVIEGALIGAWAVAAGEIYFYLRDEYPDIREFLEGELAGLREGGLIDGGEAPAFHLRRGAGAYICGEESAMLESLEGKRGLPRHKPPFPAQVGLFGRPTLINNVETLYWVRELVEKGPDRFSGKGLRSFSVSGRVREPGVKLAPAGITVRQLIDEYCGGMAEGHTFKAYLPGGASGGFLPASLGDVPLDFGTLEEHGSFIGSAAIIVLSNHDPIAGAALNLMRFFEKESCGQCTPCRAGTEKAVQLMTDQAWDRELLPELADCMASASICGLGQAAANPLLTAFRHFPEEIP